MAALNKELVYVGDPQCSWCWGFAPVKSEIEDLCRGKAALTLVVGGLHADWTEPADAERKQFLREHWEEVGERTGQPFIYDILGADGLTYGTEASCRAAVTVRQIAGNDAALQFFTGLQRAYYAESRDVTSGEVLADIAAEFGYDRSAFVALFAAQKTRQQTVMDFQFARRLGVSGFPTVLINDVNGYAYLTKGYQPIELLGHIVEAWLNDDVEHA